MSNLSEKEKYAIKELTEIKELVEEDLQYAHYEVTATLNKMDLKSLVIILNLIDKQQKELDKKDKIINEMANNIADNSNVYENLVNTEFQHTAEEVIDYFTKKVEGDK